MRARTGHARIALKAAVSLAFLAAVAVHVDPGELAGRLRGVDPAPLVLAMALNLGLQVLNAVKLRLLFPEPRPPLAGTTAVNFIAVFFATFLPGGVGGEVARWAYLGRETGSRGRALAAILMDRITGLWAQVLLALLAWLWMARGGIALAAALPAALALLGFSLWAGLRGYAALVGLARRLAAWKARRGGVARAGMPGASDQADAGEAADAGGGESLETSLALLLASRPRFLRVAALGILYQVLVLAAFLLLDRSLGGHLPWDAAMLYLFCWSVVLLLPVALGNWGLSEGTLALLYRYGGAGSEAGVLMSLLIRAMGVPAALAGWLLFLGRRGLKAERP